VNQFGWEDIVTVEKVDNASVFKRLREDQVQPWIEDHRLGYIWEMNLIGGNPLS